MIANISKHPKYPAWRAMRDRCNNPNVDSYPRYGGRGIKVCDRWMDSFVNFITDMGEPPTIKHTIERDDNSGNYCPNNCRWATQSEQQRNTRRNVFYTINGESKCLVEWCELYGINYKFVWHRINREGWEVVAALTTPKIPQKDRDHSERGVRLTHNGESLTVAQWAKRTGIKETTLYWRIRKGKSIEDVLKS